MKRQKDIILEIEPPRSEGVQYATREIVQLLSHVHLFATPWTVAHQTSLSSTISQSLLKFMFTGSVMLSNHLILCCLHLLLPSFFPNINVFFQLFASGSQSIGASALASVLPVNIQGWFPLGLTSLICLLSKGLSRVFSNTTFWKHLFFGIQPSLWSDSHIRTWLLEKSSFWLYGTLLAKWYLCFLMCCLGLSQFPFQEQESFNFMAAVTIHSDFDVQEKKYVNASTYSPSICH